MPSASPTTTIDILLNLVPDSPNSVLTHLQTHPHLASQRDSNGYSLLHAAISYSALDLSRSLINEFGVDPNLVDNDHETCLYGAETVEAAKCGVEELGTDWRWRNSEGKTAEERIEEDEEGEEVVAYLRNLRENGRESSQNTEDESNGGLRHPPPLPDGVKINIGTMNEQAEGAGEVDPEFKRRIEELAARDDFQGEEGQTALRDLVQDAVTGLAGDSRNTRPRNG
ncbi:MAG: hypothetical protein M1820_000765 [Bogoriella megaspora]|nr:MAG: hypothetical protein M1820_000765 [Bogoriella megaspora]